MVPVQVQRLNKDNFIHWRPQIAELIDTSASINFQGYELSNDYGDKRCEELVTYIKDGSAIVFVAYENSTLFGWLWCHGIRRINRNRLHIAEISVVDEHKRKGVGKTLLHTAEKYAKENDYQEVDLLVTAGNCDAVSFYESSSYSVERYLMKKEIF